MKCDKYVTHILNGSQLERRVIIKSTDAQLLNPREWPSLHETYSSFALAVLKAIVLKKVGNIFISQYIFTSIRLKYFNMKKHFSDSLILRYFQEIGFSDQKPMILCAPSTSRWSRNRARNADQAARTCEKFADFMVRIIRLYYYQNMVDTFVWEIHEVRKGTWFFSWLCCTGADWLVRQTPITWVIFTKRFASQVFMQLSKLIFLLLGSHPIQDLGTVICHS